MLRVRLKTTTLGSFNAAYLNERYRLASYESSIYRILIGIYSTVTCSTLFLVSAS